MHLTRLVLNPRSADTRRDLGNAHNMHRRVMSAFPDEQLGAGARHKHGVLFRIEDARGNLHLLVQSETEPDWSKLPDGYLLETFEPNPAHADLARHLRSLEAGQRLRFRLRANATKRAGNRDERHRGKRVELVGIEPCLKWLIRKQVVAGFALSKTGHGTENEYDVRVTEEPKVRGGRSGKAITFGSVLFDGHLIVTEPDALRAAIARGFGTAKAYGFGLLSVGRAG